MRNVVGAKRARVNDLFALFTAIIIVVLDQLTKNLVVQHLSPPQSQPPIPIIGDYLSIYYIQNNGAAFSLLANNTALALLIIAAIAIILYLYIRMLNNGPLVYKLVFGMIIGGAAGNLLDRATRGGYVVDFIWFQIPQINYSFAIFNIAGNRMYLVGVFLLFVLLLVGGIHRNRTAPGEKVLDSDNNLHHPHRHPPPVEHYTRKNKMHNPDSTSPYDIYIVQTDEIGQRLDRYLTTLMPDISRTGIQHTIAEGGVLVNGRPGKAGYALREGDEI